jgi:RNA polymerase sigma-70 factor (ECF subfamily)
MDQDMEHSSTRRDEADLSAMKPEEWVEKDGDKLFGYALQDTQERHLAEDLLQETFLAALRSKDTLT